MTANSGGKYNGARRICAGFFGIVVATLAVCLAVYAGQSGDVERRFLHEAAQGNLQNVFLVRMFRGFVAFPRTFVALGLLGSGNPHFLVSLHKDASLETMGHVTLGLFVTTQGGRRKDPQSGADLPSHPNRTDQRGALSIEYYDPTGDAPVPTVLIRDDASYILLTGSATILAEDLVQAHIALTGPPDIFSPGWRTGLRPLPSQGADPVTQLNKLEHQQPCESRVLRFALVYVGGATSPAMIRIYRGLNVDAFQQTGLEPDDFIIAIDGRSIRPDEDLYHLMREVANGKTVTFSIRRNRALMELVLTPASAKRALAQCPQS